VTSPGTELTSAPAARQRCPHCRRNRDLDEFSPSQRGVIGRWCRECMNRYRRLRRRAKRPPSYAAVHGRLTRYRGPAGQHTCWNCGERRAEDWCYGHTDPLEIVGTWNGRPAVWSTDLKHYKPLCRRCHRKLDARARNQKLATSSPDHDA
jgi:hypothetical protein